jgi:chromatin modification-related protein EAF6
VTLASMADKAAPAQAPAAASEGRPAHVSPADYSSYQKERQALRTATSQQQRLRSQLVNIDAEIARLENEYLESTPMGNIISGFDNYTKGTSSAAAQRRRTGHIDQNRVFSRSSISYNPLNPDSIPELGSSTSTPGAPTPVSSSFGTKEKGGSDQPTPTSATDKKGPSHKKKKSKAVAGADEDSETDTTTRDSKKVRTSFGARK